MQGPLKIPRNKPQWFWRRRPQLARYTQEQAKGNKGVLGKASLANRWWVMTKLVSAFKSVAGVHSGGGEEASD